MPIKTPQPLDGTPIEPYRAKLKLVRPQEHEFSSDEVEVEVTAMSLAELESELTDAYQVADSVCSAAANAQQRAGGPHATPQQPQAGYAPPAQPQGYPQQQPAPGYGGPGMSLQEAEMVASPCGPDVGTPFYACTDQSLKYIATKFKKAGNEKIAAAVVLAARQQGLTQQRGQF